MWQAESQFYYQNRKCVINLNEAPTSLNNNTRRKVEKKRHLVIVGANDLISPELWELCGSECCFELLEFDKNIPCIFGGTAPTLLFFLFCDWSLSTF